MPSSQRADTLTAVCCKLGVEFRNPALLEQALIHSSYANERKAGLTDHNERLEFLGDAVLDLVIGDYLFRKFPALPEGELTKARATVVCEQTLARRAKELEVGDYLKLGKGEAASGGRERISILADAFEAIIGAIYLDGGFGAASKFVLTQLEPDLALVERGDYAQDYKTLLQEIIQRNSNHKITYEVVGESGPDHNKTFEVAVGVNGDRLGVGRGKNKKEAEQNAARQALQELQT